MAQRILVVDDNRANLDLMVYLLEAFGFEVRSAADGMHGLEATRNTTFDAILCDVLMPGIDGFEFARRFRAQTPRAHTTLIAVTALAMVGDRERILDSGFDGYITKPIEPERFNEQLQAFLNVAKREAAQFESAGDTSAAATPIGPSILVVDDVPVNIDVVRGALEPFGFAIRAANDGVEALTMIEAEPPDLILCDLHMPGGGGFYVLTQVKQRESLARIPVLLMSSTTWHSADKERALKLGALKLLHRPIDPKQLLVEVKTALTAV